MARLTLFATVGALTISALALASPAKDQAPDDPAQVLSFTMNRLDGKTQNLADYRGKVVLMVNVASKCGYTPQYEGLQKLYETYKDQGLVILGFPANNFRSQEPGTDKEIAEFCTQNYGVQFPMFSKISVKGADQHPLYKKLTSRPAPIGGEVKWNFQKYLVDRSGHVVVEFDSPVKPMGEKLTSKIEELLKKKG
jgi:glutathione peroxidase